LLNHGEQWHGES